MISSPNFKQVLFKTIGYQDIKQLEYVTDLKSNRDISPVTKPTPRIFRWTEHESKCPSYWRPPYHRLQSIDGTRGTNWVKPRGLPLSLGMFWRPSPVGYCIQFGTNNNMRLGASVFIDTSDQLIDSNDVFRDEPLKCCADPRGWGVFRRCPYSARLAAFLARGVLNFFSAWRSPYSFYTSKLWTKILSCFREFCWANNKYMQGETFQECAG